ncbi:MAG: ShlB/FhaC/HecB family hemolysin secretion/activation protein [Saprospiraceae bacterium]
MILTKHILFSLLFLFCNLLSFGQNKNYKHQVLLVGNICDAVDDNNFYQHLETVIKNNRRPFSLILNGDLTDAKFESKKWNAQMERIHFLIKTVETNPKGKIILIAGDRDWNKSRKGGQKQFGKLEKKIKSFIKDNNFKRTEWTNKKGCPGPDTYELDESLLLIVANSQWWNHPFDKPRAEDGLCTVITGEDFAEELESEVKENQDKNIIIAGHHPFESFGNYGGHFSFTDHLKPFPIIGSFKTAYHRNIGTPEDISNEHLHEYREEFHNLFFFHKNLIYVSGHEKNQQIIQDGENYLINSGAPSKGKYAGQHENGIVSSKKAGIIVLNYFDSGKIESSFWEKKKEGLMPQETYLLFESSCIEGSSADKKTPINFSYTPCLSKEKAAKKMQRNYVDTLAIAGPEYKSGAWKKIWLGKHYRTTWTQPVKVPTLDLDTTYGGLTIYKKGGGRQTTSLKFKADDGTQFTFRSVNKDPSKAFNYKLRPTFITPLMRDQTSTQSPYGAMTVAALLDEIDILHATPTLYILPDDPKLGVFQKRYGNLLGMLEDNPSKPNDAGEIFGGADKIYQSNKLYKKLYETRKNRIDEKEFIKARVFDMLIGDWSKHEDNWKWARFDQEDGLLFRPIPRDRDHTFSLQDGIIPWLANRSWAVKNIETFSYDLKKKELRSLMYQAIHMDRFLSTTGTKEDWLAAAKSIQENISDEEIDQAVLKMPLEIQTTSGSTIAKKLKSRIKHLDKYAGWYYDYLAKYVDVIGSNKAEYFEITRMDNGNVNLKIFNKKKKAKGKNLYYERTFYPKETKELRIYGLAGNDIFDIKGNGKSKILIRILGNSGDDLFKDKAQSSKTKTLLYDKGKGTEFKTGKGSKVVKHWNKKIYDYDRMAFDYNWNTPILGMSYNNFNGLSLKLGTTFVRQKFGKKDYGSTHSIYASASTKKNFAINYSGRFHHVLKNWDIPFEVDFARPEFRNNFFGVGNNTTNLEVKQDADFYRFSRNKFSIETGIGKQFWKKSSLDFLIGYETSNFDDPGNSILGVDSSLFGANINLGEIPVKAKAVIDFRDQKGFPYNGILWLLDYRFGTIVDGVPETATYGIAQSSIEYYISSKHQNPVTLGVRFGGAVTHGDVPFYHLPNIGGAFGLRGFIGERFTGESSLYINSEIRWQLFHRYTSFVPIKFGLKAFYDTGRVYSNFDDVNSSKWHAGYGVGIFIIPLNEAVSISLQVGFSEEESFYPVISFGRAL